jgi:6-phosphofructokinase 2
VVFSGANANGLGNCAYRELIEIAKNKNVKTVLDTRGKALLSALKAKPFIIKPNIKEAEYILRRRLNSLPKIKEALRHLLGCGIKVAIISMGDGGAAASDGNEMLLAAIPRLKSKNSMGCGDALVGGFLFSHSCGESFRDCVKIAVAAGAASALTAKPGYFKKEDFKKIYGRVNITRG